MKGSAKSKKCLRFFDFLDYRFEYEGSLFFTAGTYAILPSAVTLQSLPVL